MTENFPLVSIAIISYNQVDFIEETLMSALTQDYKNLEVIIADDGSTDGTADIILDYAKKYPNRLVALVGGSNLGITGNSNRMIKECKGKYIAFMGGDDVLLPGKISKQVEWFEESVDRVLCYHDMDVFESLSNKTLYFQSRMEFFHEGGAVEIIKNGTFFGATTAMIRKPKELLLFDGRIPVASDWLYWFEVLEIQGGVLGFVSGVYARYRKHGNNITSVSSHGLRDQMLTLDIIDEKYPVYKKAVKRKRAELLFYYGYKSFVDKDFSRGCWLFFKSFKDFPNFLKTIYSFIVIKKYRAGNLGILSTVYSDQS